MIVLNRYNEVKAKLDNIKTEIIIQERLRETHLKTIERLSLQKEEKEHQLEVLEKALKVFQKVSDERNEGAKKGLETVINWALSKILTDQSYEVRIEESSDARSGKIMDLYLIDTNTGKTRSLKYQTGTALSQVVSFLMLLTMIKFADASKVLILDELFSGFEEREMVRMFSDILASLAKNDGFQIIIVEHNRLISENPDFKRIYVDLDEYEDGLEIKKIEG